jgi:uncharacterized protein (DUF2141 family)
MTRRRLTLLLGACALAPALIATPPSSAPATPAPAASAATATGLTVKITGIKRDQGNLRLAVHNNESGFPKKWEAALKVVTVAIPAGKNEVSLQIDDLKPGTYARIAHHDEDADGTIKRYWIGMPAEGMANSGTKPLMGPPSWKKSVFTLPETTTVTLTLSYL